VLSRRYDTAWRDADERDAQSEDKRRHNTWDLCQDAAYEVIEFPTGDIPEEIRPVLDTAARRACICFEQQMLAADSRKSPRSGRRILARVLTEAGF
jgi:uncharacterized protein YijF (DUF1287 family)